MVVASQIVVAVHQVLYHGLSQVDVRTRVGRHAGASGLGFQSLLFGLATSFACGFCLSLFDWHGSIGSQVESGRIVQMSQIDHAPVRLARLNARFR